jgi:hypothetical protein
MEHEDLDYYIEIGAVDISGVDKDGEILFTITEKAKYLAPDLWEAHVKFIDKALLDLFNKNLINVEYNENLEATISYTPEAESLLKEIGLSHNDGD